MPLLVRPCHRHVFRQVLDDALRLERQAFGEAVDDDAIRLASLDALGRVTATVRITADPPRQGLLGAILPRGPQVVELSRLSADPRLPWAERLATLLELRAGLAVLCLRHGWTCAVVVGHDRHIQPFIRSGMSVQALGPPALLPGDSQLSFAVQASDPDRHRWAAQSRAGRLDPLQDPDTDPALFTRYGDLAVA